MYKISLLIILYLFQPAPIGNSAQSTSHSDNFYNQGQYEQAIKQWQTALKQEPQSAQLHSNLGCALYRAGHTAEALKEWQTALSSAQDNLQAARIYYNIGNYYYDEHDKAKAIDAYKTALLLNPDDKRAKYNLEVALKNEPPPQPPPPANNPNNSGEPPPPKPNEPQKSPGMSPEEAENILNAVQQNERGNLNKGKKPNNSPQVNSQRDW